MYKLLHLRRDPLFLKASMQSNPSHEADARYIRPHEKGWRYKQQPHKYSYNNLGQRESFLVHIKGMFCETLRQLRFREHIEHLCSNRFWRKALPDQGNGDSQLVLMNRDLNQSRSSSMASYSSRNVRSNSPARWTPARLGKIMRTFLTEMHPF